MKGNIRKIFRLGLGGLILVAALPTHYANASGYRLEFQSPSVLADAGEAAVVEDAGTNWYNPAGLTMLPQQAVMGSMYVNEGTKFTGSATAPSTFGSAFNFNGSGTKVSYVRPILPLFHYSIPFHQRFAFGISVVPNWGLSETWTEGSFLRYDLVYIATKTIDVAPSIAMKINDKVSVALGPDFNYFALYDKSRSLTEGPLSSGGTVNDSISRVSANQWKLGWHAGVLFNLSDATRIGLNYRAKVVMKLRGYSDFDLNGIASYEANSFTYHTVFPATTTLSAYHDVNPRWAIMGTISYDQWSAIRYNNAQNYQSIPSGSNPSGQINVAIPEFYNNTVDISVGTHYKVNPKLMLRGSLKFEQSPTVNLTRNIDFPDAGKFGINIGARYIINQKFWLDMMYGHVFTNPVWINNTSPVSGENVNGRVHTNINVAGAQLVWNI